MALTIVQCFTAHMSIFIVKYNVLLGLFKFGLGLEVLASASALSVWPLLTSLLFIHSDKHNSNNTVTNDGCQKRHVSTTAGHQSLCTTIQ